MIGGRVLRRQLEEFHRLLGERDMAVLRSLEKCRYQTTGQLQRLFFLEHSNVSAATRAANRSLKKLREYGLIHSLERRIGGVRAGSGAFVWLLSEAGVRLLHLNQPSYNIRKRFFDPSPIFLRHTLAVAEASTQLTEICRQYEIKLEACDLEPDCWRRYTDELNRSAILKPDMFAVTVSDGYEDSWFIEIDLDTESPMVVLEKCRRYCHYFKNGTEQKRLGVFPLVTWIVLSPARKESLERHITKHRELQPKNIFQIITADKFEKLIRYGAVSLTESEAAS